MTQTVFVLLQQEHGIDCTFEVVSVFSSMYLAQRHVPAAWEFNASGWEGWYATVPRDDPFEYDHYRIDEYRIDTPVDPPGGQR